jgi:hypothetical protein
MTAKKPNRSKILARLGTVVVLCAAAVGGWKFATGRHGPPQRHVTPEIAAEIRRLLPKGSTVDVNAPDSSSEVLNFASEVHGYLMENGYMVGMTTAGKPHSDKPFVIYPKPLPGLPGQYVIEIAAQ